MTYMNGTNPEAVWPLPKFSFLVKWGSVEGLVFEEVTGLDAETKVMEYRVGNSAVFSSVKMPGLQKHANVTLKKGTFPKGNDFFAWYSSLKMNTTAGVAVIIQLLDESGNPAMTWTLANAWPTKITGTDLNSDGNEVAIESIEIAHEGLTVYADNRIP